MNRRHINEMLKTNLANGGRAAGTGILYDKYDDESGGPTYHAPSGPVRFPSDGLTVEEREALNGPVITYKRSCENCGNLRCANSIVAFWWDECVKTKFEKHWIPKEVQR